MAARRIRDPFTSRRGRGSCAAGYGAHALIATMQPHPHRAGRDIRKQQAHTCMTSIRPLAIALATLMAVPAAFAQDAATDTASASGKRFAVVGGAAILKPDRDPAPGLKIDGDVAPVISASWYATDNIAVELWG